MQWPVTTKAVATKDRRGPAQAVQSLYRESEPARGIDIDRELDIYLTGLFRDTVELVPDAAMVGVTPIDPRGTPETVARTVSAVEAINAVQYQAGQGLVWRPPPRSLSLLPAVLTLRRDGRPSQTWRAPTASTASCSYRFPVCGLGYAPARSTYTAPEMQVSRKRTLR